MVTSGTVITCTFLKKIFLYSNTSNPVTATTSEVYPYYQLDTVLQNTDSLAKCTWGGRKGVLIDLALKIISQEESLYFCRCSKRLVCVDFSFDCLHNGYGGVQKFHVKLSFSATVHEPGTDQKHTALLKSDKLTCGLIIKIWL